MTTYYKATRPDGTDFHTGTVDYAAALASGETITHPVGDITRGAESYLSVATVPTDCTGMLWPCRLFAVEVVGDYKHPASPDLPNKVAAAAVRVIAEFPAHESLGPQGEHIAAMVTRAHALTLDEFNRLDATRDAAWDATRDAARDAAWNAAWDAAWDATLGLVVRDLITIEQYRLLVGTWASVCGWPHPDDEAI